LKQEKAWQLVYYQNMDQNSFISNEDEFLQSEHWRKFQEAVGRKTYVIKDDNFSLSIIEHSLPIVGKYWYAPRWPSSRISNFHFPIFNELISSAMKNNIGWIRIEPENGEILGVIKKNIKQKIS